MKSQATQPKQAVDGRFEADISERLMESQSRLELLERRDGHWLSLDFDDRDYNDGRPRHQAI